MSIDKDQELKDLKGKEKRLQTQLDNLYVDPLDPSKGYKPSILDASILDASLRRQLTANQEAQNILFTTSSKRSVRGAWRLTAIIPRGASFQHLRMELYRLAEVSCAFGGFIRYGDGTNVVTGASDIELELYYESCQHARLMETNIVSAVRDRWRASMPTVSVTDASDAVSIESMNRVFSHHYDRAASPSDRVLFEYKAVDDRSSTATSVLDVTEIDNESVVDRTKTNLKFEKCHIDASIKGTAEDTTGNHIPLPFDWHCFFHAQTSDGTASISIVGANPSCAGAADSEGRAPVLVHVYFDPASPDAPLLHTKLRSATQVRQNVFAVTVYKKEADKFVKHLQSRHNAVVQKWNKLP